MAKRKKDQAKAIPLDPFEEMENHQTELADAKISDAGPLEDRVEETTALESETTTAKKKTKEKTKKKSVVKPRAMKKPKKTAEEKSIAPRVKVQQQPADQQVMERVDGELEELSETPPQIEHDAGDPLDELMAIIDSDERATDVEAMLAGVLPEPLEMIPTEQHVVFILEGKEYTIPINNVLEIGQPITATSLPFVPEWLLGIANLRGEIISIVDLRRYLGMPEASVKHTHRFMIVRTDQDDMRMGIIVDRVLGSHHLVVEHIEEGKSPIEDPLASCVRATYDHAGRSLIVLDFDRFLMSAELQQFKSM